MIVVASDGTGDYIKVNDALDAIENSHGEKIQIFLKNGVYKEKIRMMHANVALIGESAEKTIITFDDCAKKTLRDGTRMGTFNSYTFYVGASNFTADNITFENSAGRGNIVGQAVAMYVDADKAIFKNCRFLGWQDTLFTGPLPDNPVPVGVNPIHPMAGFANYVVDKPFRHYFENCYIEGDIDFIFGSSIAVFYKCTICSLEIRSEKTGFITAASTIPGQKYGYVFHNCKLTGRYSHESSYLGRPWRISAKTVFLNCELGSHIYKAAWHDWDKPQAHDCAAFGEYGSTGPTVVPSKRPAWIKQLDESEIKEYSIGNVLAGDDNWNPASII